MKSDLNTREEQILTELKNDQESISVTNLAARINYFTSDRLRVHLQRLENRGLICERLPYQQKSVRLTEKGKAMAAALAAEKEAA
jgi:DNA-binding MarR family transcriptional regulator